MDVHDNLYLDTGLYHLFRSVQNEGKPRVGMNKTFQQFCISLFTVVISSRNFCAKDLGFLLSCFR